MGRTEPSSSPHPHHDHTLPTPDTLWIKNELVCQREHGHNHKVQDDTASLKGLEKGRLTENQLPFVSWTKESCHVLRSLFAGVGDGIG